MSRLNPLLSTLDSSWWSRHMNSIILANIHPVNLKCIVFFRHLVELPDQWSHFVNASRNRLVCFTPSDRLYWSVGTNIFFKWQKKAMLCEFPGILWLLMLCEVVFFADLTVHLLHWTKDEKKGVGQQLKFLSHSYYTFYSLTSVFNLSQLKMQQEWIVNQSQLLVSRNLNVVLSMLDHNDNVILLLVTESAFRQKTALPKIGAAIVGACCCRYVGEDEIGSRKSSFSNRLQCLKVYQMLKQCSL